jgi:capsular polysaccharide biosynthesis protein
LSFEDQIAVDVTTDVMVGPHGAGLMHNVFMPDRGSLVELFVDGSSANRHFHNLATWAVRKNKRKKKKKQQARRGLSVYVGFA